MASGGFLSAGSTQKPLLVKTMLGTNSIQVGLRMMTLSGRFSSAGKAAMSSAPSALREAMNSSVAFSINERVRLSMLAAVSVE
jgi:hypothetical protein